VHGVNGVLLVEEIAVKAEYRRQGVAIALFQKQIGFAKHQDMKQIYETINLDNDTSIKFNLEIMSQR
jgi:N-acetylglutamate synthase-like GNAT family acetyltransferase